MSPTISSASTDIVRVLSAYLPDGPRTAEYGQYFSLDPDSLALVDPLAVGMLTAAFEGSCDNPPLEDMTAASIAAWAYVQVGSAPPTPPTDFIASVNEMVSDASMDRNGVLLASESIEELGIGLESLAEALQEADTDSRLASAMEALAGFLEAIQSRAELDYRHSYEGTVVMETAAVNWFLDNMQAIIDYTTVLASLDGIHFGLKSGLDEALKSLVPGYDSFSEDAR